ncbi:DNA-directed RNA polymerase III subunit rpc5 [Yarrowia sp. B02]|nr:DNA-directed RNA polymerase III subunit rpc5 [Yarrowia sp. B02]
MSDLFVPDEDVEVKTEDAMDVDVDGSDDPIVKEFPVFFSTRLAGNIHLYQYPARSVDSPYTTSHATGISESRIKKDSGVVEVDVPVPTDRCYDEAKGNQWKQINHQTLKGHLVVSNPQENMVGVFKNNELHLNPIVSTALLRPSFDHVNQENIKDPAAAAAAKRAAQNVNEPKAIQMTVKSSSEQTPRFSGALLAVKKAEDEEFVTMQWRDRDQEDTWDVGELLTAEKKEKLECTTTRDEYLEAISVPYVDPVTMAERCL